MKFSEYVPLAMRTCKSLPAAEHINHMCLGVVGEMGELVDQIKKVYVYGKDVDKVNIVEEVGDLSWYIAGIASHFPDTISWFEDTDIESEVDQVKLEAAKGRLTRTILLNQLAFSSLAVELGSVVDTLEAGVLEDEARKEGEGLARELVISLYKSLYATALVLEVNLETAYTVNISKLVKRYGDKYSDFSALNRDIEAERKVLEAGV